MVGYVLAGFYGIGMTGLGLVNASVTFAGISMFSGFIQNAHLIAEFINVGEQLHN
jgi:uncharacterized membrane protein